MNMEKYIVRLTDEECRKLETIVKKLKGTSQKIKRAIVLLKVDADGPDWKDQDIADVFFARDCVSRICGNDWLLKVSIDGH